MQFGFTLKPEHTLERTLALTRQAEAAGLRLERRVGPKLGYFARFRA